MPRFPKPAEGSWTQHYPELGTGPVSYEDSINPEIYELERKAIFRRAGSMSAAPNRFRVKEVTSRRNSRRSTRRSSWCAPAAAR